MSATFSFSPRILIVSTRYFPYIGGMETRAYEVAKRLVRAGVDVTVLTTDPSGKLPTDEEVEQVKIKRVRAWPAEKDYYFAPALMSYIRQGEWDLVHCQGYHTLVPPMAMLAAKQARIPYILSFQSGGNSSRTRNALRSVQHMMLRPLLAGAERLIGLSRFEVDFFQKQLNLPRERFVVIPSGANLPKVSKAQKANEEKLIISLARLERYKGHHHLIEALPLVLKRYPSTKVRIIGSGPYEAELWRIAERLNVADRVQIGRIEGADRQKMAEVLSEASLVTLLSEYESQGIAAWEALALGCPVLVSDNSALSELVEEGQARAVPKNSSTKEVAAAIVQQLDQPLIPRAIALPTWDQCATDILALYESIRGGQHAYRYAY